MTKIYPLLPITISIPTYTKIFYDPRSASRNNGLARKELTENRLYMVTREDRDGSTGTIKQHSNTLCDNQHNIIDL